MGSGGGKMVSMLTVYSDDPSSNPVEVYSFYSVNCLEITKINKNEAGDVPIFFKKKMTEEKSKKTKNK